MATDFVPGQVIEPQYTSMWVEPNGKCHWVPECGHAVTAITLGSTDSALERAGWLHFSIVSGMMNNIYMDYTAKYSQKQLDVLYDILYTIKDDRERVRYEKTLQNFIKNYTQS
jgi:hypothetical protein